MKRLFAAVLFLAGPALPAGAGIRIVPPRIARPPVAPFVPSYTGSLALSMAREPYFAGAVLGALEGHLSRVAEMRSAEEVAAYLTQAAVRPSGAKDLKQVSAKLGKETLDPEAASAILLANGLARPDQFGEILEGMERMKPAWGQRAAAMMKEAGAKGGGSGGLLKRLRDVGAKLRPSPYPGTYNAAGELNGLFDGSR